MIFRAERKLQETEVDVTGCESLAILPAKAFAQF